MGTTKTKNLLATQLQAFALATTFAIGPAAAVGAPSEAGEDASTGEACEESSSEPGERASTAAASLDPMGSISQLEQLIQVAVREGAAKPEACGALLEQVLKGLSAAERAGLISELATSPNPASRLVLAHALSHGFMSLGVPLALALLATDEDQQVRAVASASRERALFRRG